MKDGKEITDLAEKLNEGDYSVVIKATDNNKYFTNELTAKIEVIKYKKQDLPTLLDINYKTYTFTGFDAFINAQQQLADLAGIKLDKIKDDKKIKYELKDPNEEVVSDFSTPLKTKGTYTLKIKLDVEDDSYFNKGNTEIKINIPELINLSGLNLANFTQTTNNSLKNLIDKGMIDVINKSGVDELTNNDILFTLYFNGLKIEESETNKLKQGEYNLVITANSDTKFKGATSIKITVFKV